MRKPYTSDLSDAQWALFELWARDHYDPAVADEAIARTRNVMDGRGFARYAAFADELARLDQAGDSQALVQTLYPGLIEWSRTVVAHRP